MARSKRTSSVLELARQRLAGIKSISPLPDFGSNLKISDYEVDINALSNKLDSHNGLLSQVDESQNELEALERGVSDKSVRMLAAAKAGYGSDSSEYEQVGGTRKSDRKRPSSRKAKPPTP